MKNNTYTLLRDKFGIAEYILDLINESEKQVSSHFEELDDTMAYNQYKVLEAFQNNNIRDMHFSWNTGYGYDDPGRDAVERVYADIFHTEAALVRPIIVNGTHALTLTLMGILRPGDEMIYCTGGPYDTLEEVIGLRGEGKGSLKEYGISYKQVELTPEGGIDYDALKEAIAYIDGRAEIEVSGNVTKENIARLTGLGVDYVSSGALTHSAPILDISLKNLHPVEN